MIIAVYIMIPSGFQHNTATLILPTGNVHFNCPKQAVVFQYQAQIIRRCAKQSKIIYLNLNNVVNVTEVKLCIINKLHNTHTTMQFI